MVGCAMHITGFSLDFGNIPPKRGRREPGEKAGPRAPQMNSLPEDLFQAVIDSISIRPSRAD